MQFKRNLIAISLTAALCQLTACGGSSSSSNAAPQPDLTSPTQNQPEPSQPDTSFPDTPQTQVLIGATADGYLVGARVCLDVNDNMACDEQEPTTTTVAKGKYEFTEIPADIDLAATSLVVEVIPGVTIDEDEPEIAIAEGYSLTAPAGKHSFISPLSTMLATEIEDNPELTPEENQQLLEQKLGLAGTDISLLDDYVAGQQPTELSGKVTNETRVQRYKQVHRVARVVAKTLGNSYTELSEADAEAEGLSKKEVRRALVATLAENIDDVVALIDQAAVAGDDNVEADVITQLKESLPLSQEDIKAKALERREAKKAKQVAFESIATSEQGLYTLVGKAKVVADAEAQSCQLAQTPAYKHSYQDVDGKQVDYYLFADGQFSLQAENSASALQWSEGAWLSADEVVTAPVATETDSENNAEDAPEKVAPAVRASSLPLANKPLASYTKAEDGWQGIYGQQQKFSEGAVAYKITTTVAQDKVMLRVGDCKEQPCNTLALTDGELATSLAELVNAPEVEAPVSVNLSTELFDVQATFFSKEEIGEQAELDVETGTLTLAITDTRKANRVQTFTTQWQKTAMGLEFTLPQWLQNHTERDATAMIFTEYDGYVRKAFKVAQGTVARHISFNDTAMNDLLANFDPEQVNQSLALKVCGIDKERPQKPEKEQSEQELKSTNGAGEQVQQEGTGANGEAGNLEETTSENSDATSNAAMDGEAQGEQAKQSANNQAS